jgi:RHS repeat-associated protein
MKKNTITIYLLFAFGVVTAQTAGESFVQTRTYLEAVTSTNSSAKQIQEVQYFDGLGRPKQVISVKASPAGNDVVAKIEYDSFGNQVINYLPVPQNGTQNGNIYPTPLSNATAPFIYGNEKIYGETKFESSPLNRIKQQIQVGAAWAGKPVTYQYKTNADGEVKRYTATCDYPTFQANIILSSTYGANQLYKTIVTDEDGNQTIEFKNGQGQIILIRKVVTSSENADTYYVYNEYDQLAYIIPPAASVNTLTPAVLHHLCYQFKYDNQNRLVEKKNPGRGWEFIVYDKQDRVVLTQDPVLGTVNNNFNKKGWLFTKYDQHGRVIYTGFFANTATRTSMQTAINNMVANPGNNEIRTTTPFTLNGSDIYYTKNAFPTGSMTILSVNYYDVYPLNSPTIPAQILGQNVQQDLQGNSASTKSLQVASYIKNIDDDLWTSNYSFYDTSGRVIGSQTINHLGGYTKKEILLDFSGVVKDSYVYHKRTSNDSEIRVKEIFQYDHQNRILSHSHLVNNGSIEPLRINVYNELGQLTTKKLGKDDDDASLQSVDYKYNIRGWMTEINNPDDLGSDFFAMRLKYQNPQDTQYGFARYNGNISEIDWKTASDKVYRRYAYKYDSLNRLSEGIFLTPYLTSETENHFYDEKVTYDFNGNIKTLNRFQKPLSDSNIAMQIDELTYEYDNANISNKLVKVTDNQPNFSGYPVGGNLIDYDLNGNMTTQVDKGITSIIYNYLNLPKQIIGSLGNTSYLYRADGIKLKKTFGTKTTDYLDGFQYENGELKSISTAEGIYSTERAEYLYNYKDHLDNVRLSFSAIDGGGAILWRENNYYPFGLMHQGYNDEDNLADFNIPYKNKYNGKELQETGMYDYGARFYMPDIGRWGVLDPLMSKYESLSPYSYVADNPINAVDPDGRKILFVNGHYQRSYAGRYILGSDRPGEDYWGDGFPFQAKVFFNDFSTMKASNFIDGSSTIGIDMSGQDRFDAGYEYAKQHINELTANMAKGETFKIVTHSEGSAYGSGVAQYLLDKGYKVSSIIHLSSDEGDEFKTPDGPETYQLVYDGDILTGNKKIAGVDKFGIVDSGLGALYVHGSTRNKGVFKQVQDLKTVRTTKNVGVVNGKTKTWTSQDPSTTKNHTSFMRIDDEIIYNQDGTHK